MPLTDVRSTPVIHNRLVFARDFLAIIIASPLIFSSGAFVVGRKRG
jgi:hypothetical protein